MSAPVSIGAAHACAAAALADTVVAMGGLSPVSALVGVHDDTLGRWLACPKHWRLDAITALGTGAQRQMGSFPLVTRWTTLFAGAVPRPDPARLVDEISSALPTLLTTARDLAEAVADRRVSFDEARQLLASMPTLRRELDRKLDRIEADARALLQAGA